MKFLMLLTMMMNLAHAVEILENETAVTPVSDIKFVKIVNFTIGNTPALRCDSFRSRCIPSGLVTLRFQLKGCADRLGPVTTHFRYNAVRNENELYVSAINIHNELSDRIRCYKAPEEDRNLRVVLMKPDVPVKVIVLDDTTVF